MIWSFDANILMHVICLNMIIHTRALKSHPRREHTPMCVCVWSFVWRLICRKLKWGLFLGAAPDWGEWMNEPAATFSQKSRFGVKVRQKICPIPVFFFLLSHTCLTHHCCIQRHDQFIFIHRFYFCFSLIIISIPAAKEKHYCFHKKVI